jgi:hypothetical protein
VTKLRFCTSCQSDREEATGEFKAGSKIKRWICRGCIDHKTASPYKNMSKEPRPTAAEVRSAMGWTRPRGQV